jgi:hypothetical protein
MHPLHFALHDGFQRHHVTIRVDGKVVFDRDGITTDLRISRADAADVEVSGPQAQIASAWSLAEYPARSRST